MKNKNVLLGLAGGIVLGLLFYNFVEKKSTKIKKSEDDSLGGDGSELEESEEEDIPTPMPVPVDNNFQDRPSPAEEGFIMKPLLPNEDVWGISENIGGGNLQISPTPISAQISSQPVLRTLSFDGNNFDLDVDLDV